MIRQKMKKQHINIPIFIPHIGCPNQCVFCNQHTISGISAFVPDENEIRKNIDGVLSTSGNAECEIAFFGGSFTGIDRDLMKKLLDIAESYVEKGVSGIRMSTRPDYISDEILDLLANYSITAIELGIQSMSDIVLAKSKRGHTAADSEKACRLIKERKISLVGQMMIGLPGADLEDEIKTALAIAELGADAVRIYPTVIFRDTPLCRMAESGTYVPLKLDEAVERSAKVLHIFEERGVECIRIGLCESENLHAEETYFAGPNHSALGELVLSRRYYDEIQALLQKSCVSLNGKNLKIFAPAGDVSKIVGHKGANKAKLIDEYGIKNIKVIEKKDILRYNIKIDIE